MTTDALEKATRLVVDCWNRGDWPGLRTLAGADYTYTDSGHRAAGVDAVLTAWSRLRTGFPDTSAEILDVRVDGPATVTCLIWRAVQSAPLPTEHGLEPPGYKRLVVADVVVMRWSAGRLARERHQHGLLSLLAPLLPAGGPH